MARDNADDEVRFEKAQPFDVTREQALSMIGKVWAGNVGDELFRLFDDGRYMDAYAMAKAKVAKQDEELVRREAEKGYEPTALVPRKFPHVGMKVCYHDNYHGTIVEILSDGDVKLDNGQVVDFNHCCEPLPHSLEYGTAHPCPACGEYLGFHNDDMHRKNIDPKYLLEKGWHLTK